MKSFTTLLLTAGCLFLAGCDKAEFVGQWQVSVQCVDHEREPGHGGGATPMHLDGTYAIAKRGDKYVLEPESGAFKDEFSDCELSLNRGMATTIDGSDFSCDAYNPGSDAANLSGTCDLTHSGRPMPHSVRIFLLKNSPIYDGETNPMIQFSHPGQAHAGWLH